LNASAGGVTGATSTTFDINPGAVAQLVWLQQPTDGSANTNISPAPVLRALDAIGNLVTTFNGTVVMTIVNDGSVLHNANLSGGTVTASGGIATFPSLQIDQDGLGYTVQATAGAVTSPVSSSFNIVL